MSDLYCPYCGHDEGEWIQYHEDINQDEFYNFKCSNCNKRYWARWEAVAVFMTEKDETYRAYLQRYRIPYILPNDNDDEE